jgi:hypothetical protein
MVALLAVFAQKTEQVHCKLLTTIETISLAIADRVHHKSSLARSAKKGATSPSICGVNFTQQQQQQHQQRSTRYVEPYNLHSLLYSYHRISSSAIYLH